MRRHQGIRVRIVHADALKYEADVLVLKYAQHLYGVDFAAHARLSRPSAEIQLPNVGAVTIVDSHGSTAASKVMFVGVPPLREFGYAEIRAFARQALASLVKSSLDLEHIALTIHGAGYGLDEIEAFRSELAGVAEAIASGMIPDALQTISFVELDLRRSARLSAALKEIAPDGVFPFGTYARADGAAGDVRAALRSAGHGSSDKPHVFVAMPFASEMDDIFHYGIQGAVNAAGLLCERADLTAFTGDVIDWVRKRIESAHLVIADLSTANANVYLEVGYAWGRGVRTVLLAKDSSELKFDVRGQRCLVYKSIKHLEENLTRELTGLLGA